MDGKTETGRRPAGRHPAARQAAGRDPRPPGGAALNRHRAASGSTLRQMADRVAADPEAVEELRRGGGGIELRPVFTAHPTEAANQSVLTKLRRIGELLEQRARTAPGEQTA